MAKISNRLVRERHPHACSPQEHSFVLTRATEMRMSSPISPTIAKRMLFNDFDIHPPLS
jgi:hypothetical protein